MQSNDCFYFVFKNAASQVTGSPYSFVRATWSRPLLYTLSGFAVVDDPKMVIVGEDGKEANDTFIEQLSSCAKAAKDHVVSMGVADPDRYKHQERKF